MISDIFFVILALVLLIPLSFLKAITFFMPVGVHNSIVYFASYILYWRGYFDINNFLNVDISLLTFIGVYYTIMLMFSAWAIVPVVGRRFKKPTISTKPGK